MNWTDHFFEWLLDIKTMMAGLFVICLLFWIWSGLDNRMYELAKELLTAIIALAVGYRLGKAANSSGAQQNGGAEKK